jgi:hypothetical protein
MPQKRRGWRYLAAVLTDSHMPRRSLVPRFDPSTLRHDYLGGLLVPVYELPVDHKAASQQKHARWQGDTRPLVRSTVNVRHADRTHRTLTRSVFAGSDRSLGPRSIGADEKPGHQPRSAACSRTSARCGQN